MAKKQPTKAELATRIRALTSQVAGAKTRASRFSSRWVEATEHNLLYHDYAVSTIESRPAIAAKRVEAGGEVYNFEIRRLEGSNAKYYIVEIAKDARASKSYFDIYSLDDAMNYFRGGIKKPLHSRFSFKCRTIPGYEAVIDKLAAARRKHEQSAD